MKNKNILVKYFDTWYVLLNNYVIFYSFIIAWLIYVKILCEMASS